MIVFIDNEEYLSIDEVMKLTGYKEDTINRKFEKGEIPRPVKFYTRNFWKESDIKSYLRSLKKSGEKM